MSATIKEQVMPKFKVRDGEAPLPRVFRQAGTPSHVLPIERLTPGMHVYVTCPGVINGFTLVRSSKRHGNALAVDTDYGIATAEYGQTIRVLGEGTS